MTEIPTEVLTSAEDLRAILEEGGRADVTVRSRRTGAHVKVSLACKKRRPEGQKGYVPRTTAAGRVGLTEGDKIDVTDPDLEWPECKVGSYGKRSNRFYPEEGADRARVWTAEHVIRYALGEFPALAEQAEVLVATRCRYCYRKLEDPVSIARMTGPECYGRRTGSRAAPRERVDFAEVMNVATGGVFPGRR